MLEIFTSKDLIDKDKFILDCNSYFYKVGIQDTDECKNIISVIDGASYLSRDRVLDRFGIAIYSDCISTSSKILICMSCEDKVFNGVELGDNAIEYMLSSCNGKVLLEPRGFYSVNFDYANLSNIIVDGKAIHSIDELEDYIWF